MASREVFSRTTDAALLFEDAAAALEADLDDLLEAAMAAVSDTTLFDRERGLLLPAILVLTGGGGTGALLLLFSECFFGFFSTISSSDDEEEDESDEEDSEEESEELLSTLLPRWRDLTIAVAFLLLANTAAAADEPLFPSVVDFSRLCKSNFRASPAAPRPFSPDSIHKDFAVLIRPS